jgi:hypothetical protein
MFLFIWYVLIFFFFFFEEESALLAYSEGSIRKHRFTERFILQISKAKSMFRTFKIQ